MNDVVERGPRPNRGEVADDLDDTLLRELWAQIVKTLREGSLVEAASLTSSRAALQTADCRSALTILNYISPFEPGTEFDPHSFVSDGGPTYCNVGFRPFMDFLYGAAQAFNPFPPSTPSFSSSDMEAMASDLFAVRQDMTEAWAQLIEEHPRLAQAVAANVAEGGDGERRRRAKRRESARETSV